MIHLAVCLYVPSLTHSSLQQKQGLPLINQIISWSTLGWWMKDFSQCHRKIHCKILFEMYVFIGNSDLTSEYAVYLFFSVFYICSSFELNTPFSPTPQHIFVSHIHLLASQYWVWQDHFKLSCYFVASQLQKICQIQILVLFFPT